MKHKKQPLLLFGSGEIKIVNAVDIVQEQT